MALFGGRGTIVQRLTQGRWRNDEERRQAIQELREANLRSGELLSLVWLEDAAVRQAAGELFIAQADAQGVQSLVREMGRRSSNERTIAGRIFNRLPEELVRPAIEELLNDKQAKQRQLGWEIALSLGGQLGIDYLQQAVENAPQMMRLSALRRLLQLVQPARIVDVLVSVAQSEDVRLAATAVQSLATVHDERVLNLMINRFAEGDPAVREQAARWLLEAAQRTPQPVRQAMLKVLSTGDDGTRRQCVQILLQTGDPREVLVELLTFMNDLIGWLKDRILETLRTFGDEILRPAVQLLQHEDENLRTSALVLAESFHDKRLVGPLCRLLKDEDWWLKITACDSLGRLQDERAVPFLAEALQDEDCNWAAIDALAQIGSPQALNPLAQLLREDRAELRMEVVRAFSRFTDERLIGILRTVREKDPSMDVRTRAAEVLRDMAARLQLNLESSEVSTTVAANMLQNPIERLLAQVREQNGSDLHIGVGEPPMIRYRGRLVRMEGYEPLSAEDTVRWVDSILEPRHKKELEEHGEVDFCHSVREVGRYRANAYQERLGMSATFRVIPNQPPTFADIGLPGHLAELLDYHQGIIMVSGPSGSGKSTTLATIINLINETKASHVITMEEPIEFVHPVKSALVNQREIGKHSGTFATALRGALREDPDVIMVGELREPEVIRMALEAAETGHLVLATMHTTSAVQTIERLITSFPPEEQMQVRLSVSESLKYVICQSLIPRKDGEGRCAVFEILKGTFNVSNLIRDGKSYQLPSLMQIGRNVGMQTVDAALLDLVEQGLITAETAYKRAQNPENFTALCAPEFIAEIQNRSGQSASADAQP